MEKIDSAVLRAGRFDKKILIPVPDLDSRQALFDLYLNKRKKVLSDDINLKKLSELTQNYVAVDIKLIVNDSARKALKNRSKISQEILQKVIEETTPSVTEKEISKYSESKTEAKSQGKKIGFKNN